MKKQKHYNVGEIEVIDVINSWKLNFNCGNILKYIGRCNYKGNKETDLQKVLTYIDYELEHQNQPLLNIDKVKYKIEMVLEDWKLSNNLSTAIINLYVYVIGGNHQVLENVRTNIKEELQDEKGKID